MSCSFFFLIEVEMRHSNSENYLTPADLDFVFIQPRSRYVIENKALLLQSSHQHSGQLAVKLGNC